MEGKKEGLKRKILMPLEEKNGRDRRETVTCGFKNSKKRIK